MDKRRYQVIGNNYACMALNAETVTGCVRNYLASGKKKLSQALNDEIETLRKWASKAEIGASLIKEEYTVIVVDEDKLKENARKRQY